VVSFLLAFPPNPCKLCIPLLSHAFYKPCPSHPHWLDHSNYMWRWVQVMKILIIPNISTLLLFHPSWDQIFSSAPCSQTPSVQVLCSSLNVRDQVSHLYKTIGLISTLFGNGWDDKRFWIEWYQALKMHKLNSPWIWTASELCIHTYFIFEITQRIVTKLRIRGSKITSVKYYS
jgi:hypothetical protein